MLDAMVVGIPVGRGVEVRVHFQDPSDLLGDHSGALHTPSLRLACSCFPTRWLGAGAMVMRCSRTRQDPAPVAPPPLVAPQVRQGREARQGPEVRQGPVALPGQEVLRERAALPGQEALQERAALPGQEALRERAALPGQEALRERAARQERAARAERARLSGMTKTKMPSMMLATTAPRIRTTPRKTWTGTAWGLRARHRTSLRCST
jgi:hypothetical protein